MSCKSNTKYLMTLRPDNELRAAFSEASLLLDAQLERSRTRLIADGIAIEDRSNRTGFDKTGFPYFLWSLWFEKRQPHGSETVSTSVELSFLEPPDVGGKREIRERWIAEIFQIGQFSRIRRVGEQQLDFQQVTTGDLASLILDSIKRAERELQSAA